MGSVQANFDRSEIPRNVFNLILGGILVLGFVGIAIGGSYASDFAEMPGPWLTILFIGLSLLIMVRNTLMLFIIHTVTSFVLGATLGAAAAQIGMANPNFVAEFAFLSAVITGLMALMGVIVPMSYNKRDSALRNGLGVLAVVCVATLFIPNLGNWTWVHYLTTSLSMLGVVHIMHRASDVGPTFRNAIDMAIFPAWIMLPDSIDEPKHN